MKYILLYLPIPVVILVLQTVLGIVFRELNHLPDLILIFCVYSAHQHGRFRGQLLGAYSGLCEDIVSAAPFATHIFIRTVISFILGHTTEWRIQNTFIVPVILVLLALCIKYLLYLLLGVVFAITNMTTFVLSVAALYEACYTVIATPVLFSLLSLIPNPHATHEA